MKNKIRLILRWILFLPLTIIVLPLNSLICFVFNKKDDSKDILLWIIKGKDA